MQTLPSFRTCLFCGTENRRGFGIRYRYDPAEARVEGEVTPDEAMCGYPGVLHGGIQAALLDDVMYWAVSHRGASSSVTLELTTRFRKTAELGRAFVLRARAAEPQGRKVRSQGELLAADGEVLAEATGLYLLHSREVFLAEMLPYFDFEGCGSEMVERYRGG